MEKVLKKYGKKLKMRKNPVSAYVLTRSATVRRLPRKRKRNIGSTGRRRTGRARAMTTMRRRPNGGRSWYVRR